MMFKSLGTAVLMALALVLFASTASATHLEISGVSQPGALTVKESLKSGTSVQFSGTSGEFVNSCTASTEEFTTTVFSGTKVEGPISSLTYSSCKEEPVVVDTRGSISIEYITGTTNGTMRWIGGKFTTPSPFGSLTCTTAASPGNDVGTLTGVASGFATKDYNVSIPCGPITGRLMASYTVTVPAGYGVTS